MLKERVSHQSFKHFRRINSTLSIHFTDFTSIMIVNQTPDRIKQATNGS